MIMYRVVIYMKVIFLDFNGVLDTWDVWDKPDLGNLQRLKHIVDETGAKIVISSSLKNSYYSSGRFGEVGTMFVNSIIDIGIEIIGITPYIGKREEEIQMYLEMHPEIENFCIIDDDYYMEKFSEYMVKLPNQIEFGSMGLDDVHMNMAIRILNNKTLKKI